MNTTPWSPWLKTLLPPWLEQISYPAAGVGDLQDLRFKVGVGEGGKWVGFINTGWFYHKNQEQYKYVLPATQSLLASSGQSTITETLSFRPSWGPVLVNSASGQPYTQHANSFSPANDLPWYSINGTDCFYTLVPLGSYVTGVRDLTNLSFGSVVSSGAVFNEKLYYYDVDSGVVVIQPKDSENINVFVDLLYTNPIIKIRELVIQKKGQVTASYGAHTGLANFKLIRGKQSITLTGTQTTNSFTNPLTGCSDSDWVVLEYYVCKSYILKDHKTIVCYTSPLSGENVSINWESSIPDVTNSINLASSPSIFNINPLFADSYRAGYLMHALPSQPLNDYWKPGSLELNLDKDIIISDFNEWIKVTAVLRSDNDLPIPYYPVTITYTSSASAVAKHPTTNTTDGRGEVHALYKINTGSSVFSFTLSAGTLSKTVSASVVLASGLIDSNRVENGFINLVITDQINSDNSLRTYINKTTLDGIPIPAPGIKITSEFASEFSDKSSSTKTSTKVLNVSTIQNVENLASFTEIGYRPQPNDRVVAQHEKAQSFIIESEK